MRMIAALAAAFVAVMTAHGDIKPPRPRPATWEVADAKSHPHLLFVTKRTMNSEPPSIEAVSHRSVTRVA